MATQPLVSVVTPVYNGAEYLATCIKSVTDQSYTNWEYVILDNGSRDDTPSIAARLAAEDDRITVATNSETIPVIDNWNRALGLISPQSEFCRILHADDWMYPTCLEKTVDAGMRHPSAAFISSWRDRGNLVQGPGLPVEQELFRGRDVAQEFFRRRHFWLSPTCSLLRSKFIRDSDPFYPPHYLHADLAAYLNIMCDNDFAMVHEVLSFSREHAESITAKIATPKETLLPEWLSFLEIYGPRLFDADELEQIKKRHLRHYYRRIARGALKLKGREFGEFHLDRLRRAGYTPTTVDFALATLSEVASAAARPAKATRYLRSRLADKARVSALPRSKS